MAPKYHMFYFPMKGRAEVIRQVFRLAGVEFEETSFDAEDEWNDWIKNWKSKSPFGQCPWMEIDEGYGSEKVVLCQSRVIARYFARRFGLTGTSLKEQATSEMIVDCIDEYIMQPTKQIRFYMKGEEKRERLKWFLEEHLPAKYASFEKQLMKNNNGEGFFVGNSLTWCDVYFTFRVLSMEHTYKYDTHIDNYPKLTALMARVQAHPKAKDCFTIATHDYKFLETA